MTTLRQTGRSQNEGGQKLPAPPPGGHLVPIFLATKSAENCEPVTIRNYRTALTRFFSAPTSPADAREVTADHLILWLAAETERGTSAAYRRWLQRHLYGFLGWMLERRELRTDPRAGVKVTRAPEPILRSLEEPEFRLLLKVAEDRPRLASGRRSLPEHYRRDIAILHLLWATGIRRNEAVLLEIDDLDLKNRLLLVRYAKGKKHRTVPFSAECAAALTEYIYGERPRNHLGAPADGKLLLARGGIPLTVSAFVLIIRRISGRAGIPVSAHDFRRGFAARVRRLGLDVGDTAELLGHETLVMTIRYSRAGKAEAAINAYRKIVG